MKKCMLFFSLFLILCSACRKDSITETTTTTTFDPPVILVTGSVFGTVVDESDQPIQNATITLNNQTIQTDEFGTFRIIDDVLDRNGTYLKAEKDGFFHNSTRIYPRPGATNYVRFKLLDLEERATLNAAQGGEVTFGNGASLELRANSFVTANGDVYDGSVRVYAEWLDPTADDLTERMPGSLEAVNIDNEAVSLATFGMIGVELRGENNEELNIGNNQESVLRFPVPTELQNNAPAQIPLWSFDEEQGLWIEEGSAEYSDGAYIGAVSHFSFWNCDAPFPLVVVEGRVLSPNGNPMVNHPVYITIQGSGYSRVGYTDSDGYFGGKVPKGEALTLEIRNDCQDVLINENIGPFDMDTNLGDFNISNRSFLVNISGSVVDCDNNPVTNGVLRYKLGDGRFIYYSLDSSHQFNFDFFGCDPVDLVVDAVDLNSLKQSDPQTFPITSSANTIDLGEIVACDVSLAEFIRLDIDGQVKVYPLPNLDLGRATTFIGYFSNQQEEQVSISFNDTLARSYTDSEVDWFFFSDDFPVNQQLQLECDSLMAACVYDKFEVTEYGQPGEKIKGNFEGTFRIRDWQTNVVSDRPVKCEFVVIRD